MSSRRFPDAVTILNKAIKVSHNYKDAHFHLGMAYLAMGSKREAMRVYAELKPINEGLAKQLLAEINKP
jgi:tetratricopeptide (TPR) repeat protein